MGVKIGVKMTMSGIVEGWDVVGRCMPGGTMSCIGHSLTIFTPIFTPTPRRETPLHPSTSNSHGEPRDVELYSYTSAVTLHLYTLYILHPSIYTQCVCGASAFPATPGDPACLPVAVHRVHRDPSEMELWRDTRDSERL